MRPTLSIAAVAMVQFWGGLLLMALCGIAWLEELQLPKISEPEALLLVYTVPGFFGLLGIASSIGLMRLKEWARQLTLVLSTIPVVGCALMLVVRPAAVFPRPQADEHEALLTVGSGIVIEVYLCVLVMLILISAWWLVLFNRPAIKEQFQRK